MSKIYRLLDHLGKMNLTSPWLDKEFKKTKRNRIVLDQSFFLWMCHLPKSEVLSLAQIHLILEKGWSRPRLGSSSWRKEKRLKQMRDWAISKKFTHVVKQEAQMQLPQCKKNYNTYPQSSQNKATGRNHCSTSTSPLTISTSKSLMLFWEELTSSESMRSCNIYSLKQADQNRDHFWF